MIENPALWWYSTSASTESTGGFRRYLMGMRSVPFSTLVLAKTICLPRSIGRPLFSRFGSVELAAMMPARSLYGSSSAKSSPALPPPPPWPPSTTGALHQWSSRKLANGSGATNCSMKLVALAAEPAQVLRLGAASHVSASTPGAHEAGCVLLACAPSNGRARARVLATTRSRMHTRGRLAMAMVASVCGWFHDGPIIDAGLRLRRHGGSVGRAVPPHTTSLTRPRITTYKIPTRRCPKIRDVGAHPPAPAHYTAATTHPTHKNGGQHVHNPCPRSGARTRGLARDHPRAVRPPSVTFQPMRALIR